MNKSKLIYFLLALITSCAFKPTATVTDEANYSSSNEVYFPAKVCSDLEVQRTPSSAEQCTYLFKDEAGKIGDTEFLKNLKNDPFAVAESNMNIASSGEKYPVKMTDKMAKFRSRFLGFIKNAVIREPIARSFEAALRMRSFLTERALKKQGYSGQYDIVIVGTGVHGILALHQILAINPHLKILLIDEGDTAGATFRYGKEVFNINSSNRRSGENSKPLPGEGNINELPGLPIQVSDLTSVKYPTANDLGISILTGLYAALREYPNVEILFNSKATQLQSNKKNSQLPESILVASDNTSDRSLTLTAQKIILTTGLGTPRLPEKVAEALKKYPRLAESINNKMPQVVTFEDAIRILASSNDPASFYNGKKIGVVGTGDSANVFIEYLLGFAARDGYARSSAQNGRAKKIIWIGQKKQTCKDFISEIRSRYQQISTGFRSSSDNFDAIITPVASRLKSVDGTKTADSFSARLEDGSQLLDLDFVVVTTGFDQNVRQLFAKLTNGRSTQLDTDTEFLDNFFDILVASTSVSRQDTKVGRKLKDREIYVLGTAAGELANKETELVGIIQNFVSIFNNAPRVVSASSLIAAKMNPLATASNLQPAKIGKAQKPQIYTINNIQESRVMANQTVSYLEGVIKEALSFTVNPSGENLRLTIQLQKNGDLRIFSDTLADISELVTLLSNSREFFSLTKELLKFTPGQSLLISANSGADKVDVSTVRIQTTPEVKLKLTSVPVNVANKQIKLRGLKQEPKPEIARTKKPLDLNSSETYQANNIFHEIAPGTVEVNAFTNATVEKPFSMMATLVTQKTWAEVLYAAGVNDTNQLVPSKNKLNTVILDEKYKVGPLYLTIKPSHPVENISVDAIKNFIQNLNSLSQSTNPQIQSLLERLFPGHQSGDNYSLPTDAQFQYVRKSPGYKQLPPYYSGNSRSEANKTSWNSSNATETQPVATKDPRVIDGKLFFDLEGNVREVVEGQTATGRQTFYTLSSSFQDVAPDALTSDKNTAANFPDVGIRLVRTRP